MTSKEKLAYRQNNRSQLGLTAEQCDMHYDLMLMTIHEWPDSLQALAKERLATFGGTTEVFSCTIADWLKAGNKLAEPYDGETEAESEAGRLKALEILKGLSQ